MVFTFIFEILLLFFHLTNSFQFVNGKEGDIPAIRNGAAIINAGTDGWFKSCHLKKNGTQICQLTWKWSSSFYLSLNCNPKYNHVPYTGGGSDYVCNFVVPNLQENGNNLKFLLCLNKSIIIFFTNN